ncbi:hypothetical protein BN1708_009144 [Verticillium longisporum]|uniref:Uncharacterized protein n=1 Tax=Verticillium longisporum TaxID=100787 RepID=A0A0G4KE32_VERLO|nr:hypothetical protein BN1708_009144 [Verticillium longisporum]
MPPMLLATSGTLEWVNIPRDPAETETGLEATPANASNTQSWADDQPEQPVQPAVSADPNDGFRQVPGRNRGNGNREGGSGFRGGRGRGDFRGGRGGFRGEGRGRGRGQRGGSSSTRGGARRNEES